MSIYDRETRAVAAIGGLAQPTYEELKDDFNKLNVAYHRLRDKEEREAWDRYFAAQAEYSKTIEWSAITIAEATVRADLMLEERRKRFP